MNREEELLVVLAEECGELIQAAMKIIRFGYSHEAHERFQDELGDVLGVVKLLAEEEYLDEDHLMMAGERKIKKLDQYMTNKRKP